MMIKWKEQLEEAYKQVLGQQCCSWGHFSVSVYNVGRQNIGEGLNRADPEPVLIF